MNSSADLTIFYDGACGVCASEMNYYQRIASSNLEFVDISAGDFEPSLYKKSNEDFQRELHVRNSEGIFFTGVDAFRALWSELPSPCYPLLSKLTGLPGVYLAACIGYSAFAKVRHLLPGSKVCKLHRKN